MRPCAQSSSTELGSRGSPRCPTPPIRCACSPAGCAARTSRRSAARPPAPCSGTRSWRVAPTGRRVALLHHRPCGECERCRAGHESTCARSPSRRSCPAGSPSGWPRRTASSSRTRSTTPPAPTSSRSRACCAEPSECRAGACSSSATASSAGCSRRCSSRRGDEVFAIDPNPERSRAGAGRPGRRGRPLRAGRRPLDAVAPGGTVLVFAGRRPGRPGRRLPARADADGLAVGDAAAHGGGGGAPPRARPARARSCCRSSASPKGSTLYRSGRALKVVFTP